VYSSIRDNPADWGPVLVASAPPLVWFIAASVLMVQKRDAVQYS
jgi:hypothetical protein